MTKAEAYAKVREKIALRFGSNVAEEIFSEFEESEDERIRNCIGMCLTDANEQRFKDYNTSLKECIAWLEKQGESTLIEEIKRRKELYSREKEKAVLFAEKLSLGGRIAVLEELLVFANEKQGEQKPILDFKASNWYASKVDGKIHDLTYNPTDKTEPTFKVGDWIVTDKNNITQIKAVNNGYYTIDNGMDFNMSYVDKYWRLWTIQDAKDGDVLWHSDSASNGIFIFKEIRYDGKVLCYCDYDSEDYFCLGEHHTCCWANAKILHPATKEQRDLLFQKMKEAGYQWDSEKKELKKIHIIDEGKAEMDYCFTKMMNGENVSPAWSDEDEKIYQSIMDDTVQENQLNDKQINWLRDIKYRYFPQSKQKWSEEDEKMLHTIIADFKGFKHDNTSTLESHFNECIDWLKSLKCRVQPKQQWCAEDKDMLYKATAVVNRLCAEGKEYVWSVNTLKELFCWLKSLKTILEEN